MQSTTTAVGSRSGGCRLRAAVHALVVALVLSACGGASGTAGSSSGAARGGGGVGGGASGPSGAPSQTSAVAQGNDADLAFLTGMVPHHEQAVEMSDIILAADPPGAVTALATRIRAAQGPEIEQMTGMLSDLGQDAAGDGDGHGGDHGTTAHGGMLSEAELQQLREATGDDAAHLYLEEMIEHHEGAIEAAETQMADGSYAPARELARKIAQDQAVEVAEMKALLAHKPPASPALHALP
jgi:uncharacterized protein (DUF305 family)